MSDFLLEQKKQNNEFFKFCVYKMFFGKKIKKFRYESDIHAMKKFLCKEKNIYFYFFSRKKSEVLEQGGSKTRDLGGVEKTPKNREKQVVVTP